MTRATSPRQVLKSEVAINHFDNQNFNQKIISTSSQTEVFLTKDKNLLDQYFALRHEAYRHENGWQEYNGLENNFDEIGRIVVAVKNGKVVGGMRLLFSDECKYLSNEFPGTQYQYKRLIEKYDKRENLIFAEISGVVVEKGSRDSHVTTAMFDKTFKESALHGCHYVFGVAVALVCRDYRKILRRLNYFLEIIISHPWEKKKLYNFTAMFPVYVNLSEKTV